MFNLIECHATKLNALYYYIEVQTIKLNIFLLFTPKFIFELIMTRKFLLVSLNYSSLDFILVNTIKQYKRLFYKYKNFLYCTIHIIFNQR